MAGRRRPRTTKQSAALAKLTAEDGTQLLGWDPGNPLAPSETLSESERANKALVDYATQGVARSMRKLLQVYQTQAADCTKYEENPGAWKRDNRERTAPIEPPTVHWMTLTDWGVKFFWQDRVKRYDEIQNEVERLEFESERRALKKERISLLKSTLSRLRAALAQLKPQSATWSEVTNGIWRISQQLREEFGDDQGEGNMAGRVRMVVIRMPAGADGVILEPASEIPDDDEDDEPVRSKVKVRRK